jgi:uncharacterized protein (TIRG00374 family)
MVRFTTLFFAVGLVSLAGMIWFVGVDDIGDGLRRVGWGFVISCSAHLGSILLDAVTYKACAGEAGARVPYRVFARACLAAHAINTSTPTGAVGEYPRYRLIRDHVPPDTALAAVILLNMIMYVTNFGFLALAPLASLLLIDIAPSFRTVLLVCSGVALAATLAVLALVRFGLGQVPVKILRLVRVRRDRVERFQARWKSMEGHRRRALDTRARRYTAWTSGVLSRIASAIEVSVILYLLGADRVVAVALLAQSTSQIVTWVLPFVPYAAGTAEGGSYLVLRAIGVDPQLGVTMELVRKARRVVFVVLGISLLGWQTFRDLVTGRAERRQRRTAAARGAPTREGT